VEKPSDATAGQTGGGNVNNYPLAKAELGSPEKPPKENETAALKCHMCGERKKSVRSRTTITIGLHSCTVRWQFCDECVAMVTKWSQPDDEQDNDRQRL